MNPIVGYIIVDPDSTGKLFAGRSWDLGRIYTTLKDAENALYNVDSFHQSSKFAYIAVVRKEKE